MTRLLHPTGKQYRVDASVCCDCKDGSRSGWLTKVAAYDYFGDDVSSTLDRFIDCLGIVRMHWNGLEYSNRLYSAVIAMFRMSGLKSGVIRERVCADMSRWYISIA